MIMNMVDNSKDIETLKNTVGYTASKNLLENTASSTTAQGITYTVNDDGSVTVNGTASSNTTIILSANLKLPNGEYILTGCPEDGSTASYYLEIIYDDSGATKLTARDTGKGYTFVIDDTNNTFTKVVRIWVQIGTTVENVTFYPMIRKASVTDDTYEPFSELDVDSRLDTLESALKSALEWKLITSDTFANKPSVSYSTLNSLNFRELMVVVTSGAPNATNSTVYGSSIAPRNHFPETFTSSHSAHWYVGMNRSKSDSNACAVDLWFYGGQSKVYPYQNGGADADIISYYYR